MVEETAEAGAPKPAISPDELQGRRRLAGLLALAALATLVALSDVLYDVVFALLGNLESLVAVNPLLAAAVYVLLTAMSAMLSFFSTAVLAPAAVHLWGGWITLLLHWGGAIIGGLGAYGIGRGLGRPATKALVGVERLSYWGSRLARRASFGAVLALQLALQSEIPGYVLGTLRYPLLLFTAALALGTLPYAVGIVYMGRLFLDRRPVLVVLVAVAALGLVAFSLARLRRLLKEPDPADG